MPGFSLRMDGPPVTHQCSRSWFGALLQGVFVPISDRKPPIFQRGDWGWNDSVIWRAEIWEYHYACNRCGQERAADHCITRYGTCPFCHNDEVFNVQKTELVRQYYEYSSNPGSQVPSIIPNNPSMWMPGGQEILLVTESNVHFLCQNCGNGDCYQYTQSTPNFQLPVGVMPGRI